MKWLLVVGAVNDKNGEEKKRVNIKKSGFLFNKIFAFNLIGMEKDSLVVSYLSSHFMYINI